VSASAVALAAIAVACVAILGSVAYALIRAIRIHGRIARIAATPAFRAAAQMLLLGSRIGESIQRPQSVHASVRAVLDSLAAASESSALIRGEVGLVASTLVTLLDVLTPSSRGSAS